MQMLQPILYKKISIHSENQARGLIESLIFRSKMVIYLFVSMPIKPNTTVKLLCHCPLLISLVLYMGGNNCSRFSALFQSVNDLPHLKYFSINPIALLKTCFVHLPNTSIFHCVTHLDLSPHWPCQWEVVIRGFNYLHHLTHLLITWQQSIVAHIYSLCLQILLSHPTTSILWFPLVIHSILALSDVNAP
jgi:hypothetical protein